MGGWNYCHLANSGRKLQDKAPRSRGIPSWNHLTSYLEPNMRPRFADTALPPRQSHAPDKCPATGRQRNPPNHRKRTTNGCDQRRTTVKSAHRSTGSRRSIKEEEFDFRKATYPERQAVSERGLWVGSWDGQAGVDRGVESQWEIQSREHEVHAGDSLDQSLDRTGLSCRGSRDMNSPCLSFLVPFPSESWVGD